MEMGYSGEMSGGILAEGRVPYPSNGAKRKYADIMMDYWFKRAFGDGVNKGRLLLLLLRELIPERKIIELKYLPTEHLNPSPEMKDIRIDVECTDSDGARFVVEMQVAKQKFFKERILYYSAHALLKQLKKGNKGYSSADSDSGEKGVKSLFYDYPPVYMISLTDFSEHPGSKKVLFRYGLAELESGELMTDRLTFIFLELPNCGDSLKEDGSLLENFCFAMRRMKFLD